ncbi:hypothetical protein FQA39_LY07560 [Lamprigera yunnana]|nr:hypothetical protein FQA39_LY07560 [Lamprigera yunnana]
MENTLRSSPSQFLFYDAVEELASLRVELTGVGELKIALLKYEIEICIRSNYLLYTRESRKPVREVTDEGKRRKECCNSYEEELMDILKQLAVDVKDIKRQQRIYAELLKAFRSDNERLRKENESIKKESEITRTDYLEKEEKKDNVVVSGVRINAQEPERVFESMKNMMKTALNIKVNIKAAQNLTETSCLLQLENTNQKNQT